MLNLVYAVFAYLLGNVLGGKIVTILYKEDFTNRGSGNVGARNAGRVLGPNAFVFVATIDFFKGFLVVILLKLFNAGALVISLCMFLVILGHIKPILFGFKGGKGVATFLGSVAALSPNMFFILVLGILLIGFVTRSTTIGFYSVLPVLIFIHYLDFKSVMASIVFLFVVIMMHIVAIDNMRHSFNRYFALKRRVVRK